MNTAAFRKRIYTLPTFTADVKNIFDHMDALRDLETTGLVVSSWGEDSLGPQRRMYTITLQGESALAEWMQALRQRRKEIESLETAYDAVKKAN